MKRSDRLAWTTVAALVGGVLLALALQPTALAPDADVTPASSAPASTPTYGPDELFDAVVSRNVPDVDLFEARTVAVHICTDLDRGTLVSEAVSAAFANLPPYAPKSQSVIVGTASVFCPTYTDTLAAEARLLYPAQAWSEPTEA